MPKTHVVKQGEHLSSIAAKNGFRNFNTILDHPANAKLKANRDPHVLFPGDQVAIPDRTTKQENRSTGNTHTFVLATKPLFLRLKLLDLDEQPVKNADCALVKKKAKTDANGIVEEQIDPDTKDALLTATVPIRTPPPDEKKIAYELRIGHLNPVTKLSGQQARLNNLGYFAGYTLLDVDQLLWAAEEFECNHGTQPVATRPTIKPAPEEGEDNNTDPAEAQTKTGIQEASILKTLSTVHDGKPNG